MKLLLSLFKNNQHHFTPLIIVCSLNVWVPGLVLEVWFHCPGVNPVLIIYCSPQQSYSKSSKHKFPPLCRWHAVIFILHKNVTQAFDRLKNCLDNIKKWLSTKKLKLNPDKTKFNKVFARTVHLFIYLGFYVAFNTVEVISRRVVGRTEETSTYSSLGFCTVNCQPTASNYQLSHLRPCRESNPGLRGGRRECYHSTTVAPVRTVQATLCKFFPINILGNLLSPAGAS